MANGHPICWYTSFQQANALDVANGVYAELEKLKKTFPEDVDYKVPFESVTIVKVSIKEVVKTLIIALLLVVFVVFLFLQNWRNALIPVLAIPVSIIGTFIFFVPLGFTINTLTLFGFVLAIGIVVDDAIIVVEAVQHYIDVEKMSAKEATKHAMKDITAPGNCCGINTGCCICSCCFYSGYCRPVIPAVCHYHCRIYTYFRFYSLILNTCFMYTAY